MAKVKKIPLKAMKAKEVPLEKLKWPLVGQLKYDGIRLLVTIDGSKPLIRTYNGSVVPLPLLEKKLEQFDGNMIDGEITIQGGRVGTRPIVSGMINSAMHGGRINENLLSFNIFDSMDVDSFNNRKCNESYRDRYNRTAVLGLRAELPVARNTFLRSPKEVEELSQRLYSDGFEGLILKPQDHLYRFTRHRDWIKIKETKTTDLLCYDTTPGTGKYEGMIGAVCCRGIVENRLVTVKPGSGMTDSDRARPPWYYIGRTIEVKYNSVIQDQTTGLWSLFLPRFNGVRIDK